MAGKVYGLGGDTPHPTPLQTDSAKTRFNILPKVIYLILSYRFSTCLFFSTFLIFILSCRIDSKLSRDRFCTRFIAPFLSNWRRQKPFLLHWQKIFLFSPSFNSLFLPSRYMGKNQPFFSIFQFSSLPDLGRKSTHFFTRRKSTVFSSPDFRPLHIWRKTKRCFHLPIFSWVYGFIGGN